MTDLYAFAKDFGFPAFVALFVLVRVEARLAALHDAVWALRTSLVGGGGRGGDSAPPRDRLS